MYGSTLEGRMEFGKKLLSSSRTPLFVDEQIVFIQTHSIRNENVMYINVLEIVDFYMKKEGLFVIFKDLSTVLVNISKISFETQIKKSHEIIDYFSKRKCLHDGLINRFYNGYLV